MLRSLSSVYPDPHCHELKKTLYNYLDSRLNFKIYDWITIGNRSTEIIHNFARAFIRDKVVIPAPTFCEYELASRRMGADILYTPLKKDLSMDKSFFKEIYKMWHPFFSRQVHIHRKLERELPLYLV